MVATPPKLDKLEQWLRLSMYSGGAGENGFVRANLVTFETLRENIQASDDELRNALETIGTIEVDGSTLCLL